MGGQRTRKQERVWAFRIPWGLHSWIQTEWPGWGVRTAGSSRVVSHTASLSGWRPRDGRAVSVSPGNLLGLRNQKVCILNRHPRGGYGQSWRNLLLASPVKGYL